MNAPVEWLLAGEPWVAYRTRRDLLRQAEDDPEREACRRAMLTDAQVEALIAGLAEWPGAVIASHKSAGQPFHRLTFLADLGASARDPGVDAIVARILEHQSAEGPFQLPMNVAVHYGGTGRDEWAWALCDAPLVVGALIELGLGREPAVRRALEHLVGLARDSGWPCAVSKALGTFRGPGRKDDPCPFATLAMLRALARVDDLSDGAAARAGADALLTLWSKSRIRHPYQFYMGTDFRKIKAPYVWYDLLHVLDVLSRFPWLREDPRLRDMFATLTAKADPEGRFTAESVWTAWKGWEYAQKKEPSRWITLQAWRIIARLEGGLSLADDTGCGSPS